MPPRAALLSLVAALVFAANASAAERWRWPVRGEVITPFQVTANPFAGGQHRGVDIAARAGAPVVAACTGRVRFAGRLPGRGRAVSIECGALVATHLELGSTSVRKGARVGRGAPIGTVAASHVQLGARRTGRLHGYVDPRKLMGRDSAPPPGIAPPPRRPEIRLPDVRLPSQAASAASHPVGDREPAPLVAWGGVALLAAALPVGAVSSQRRRQRRRLSAATVASGPP